MTGAPQPGVLPVSRLHPMAGVFVAAGFLRIAVPMLIAGWVTEAPRWVVPAIVAAIAAVAVPAGVLHWRRFTYRVRDGRLEVDSGVLVRRHRVVPLERVRGVSLDEPLVHRLLGLVRARVEAATAGDTQGELSLRAISHGQAEALRAAVVGGAVADHAVAGADPPLVFLTPGRLLLAGITSVRFVVVPLALAWGAYWSLKEHGLGRLVDRATEAARDRAPTSATGIGLLLVALALGTLVVAALGSLITDWRFQLTVDDTTASTQRGLLARRRTAASRRRLLGVEILDNPVRRMVHAAAVEAPVAGMTVTRDMEAVGRIRLLPFGSRAQVRRVVDEFAPGEPPVPLAHPRAALQRRLVRGVAIPAVAAVALAVSGQPWLAAAAVLAAAAMVPVAFDRYRNLHHGLGRWLVVSAGSLGRRRSILDPGGVVVTSLTSSPFQRRTGLCSVRVHLGVGVGGRTAVDMGDDQARALVARLHPWMRADAPTAGAARD